MVSDRTLMIHALTQFTPHTPQHREAARKSFKAMSTPDLEDLYRQHLRGPERRTLEESKAFYSRIAEICTPQGTP